MNTKTLHVKNGVIAAITMEGESFQAYGQLHVVGFDEEYGVGDTFPRDARPATVVCDVNATKPEGVTPKTLGGSPKRKPAAEKTE
jgi:hypothetical protein